MFTAQEIADALNLAKGSVCRKAAAEGWRHTVETGRGGKRLLFDLDSLPEGVRLAVLAKQGQERVVEKAQSLALFAPNALPEIRQTEQEAALCRADLVRQYCDALNNAGWGSKVDARDGFISAYNSGLLLPDLYKRLGPVSWKTIERWKTALNKKKDTLALADRRGGAQRGQTDINPDAAKVLLALALNPNRPTVASCLRQARKIWAVKGIQDGLSDTTYRRWLTEWKNRNIHIWTFSRQGAKAWNDQCAFYLTRDYEALEVGDVVVADGHNLNFEIINPWTGKPKRMTLLLWYDMKSNMPLGWEIMPTEDTACISSALRRAILALGFFPKVAYLDNGRAFRAKFFRGCKDFNEAGIVGLYERLGMKVTLAWPYHGQSKTVERFFGTFNELERMAPTYSGASITDKPPRMNRGERLHRAVWDKAFAGKGVTLAQAHAAIAAWFDEYASRKCKDGHLKGQRPVDVFLAGKGPGVNVELLNNLMLAQEIRAITREGVKLFGRRYYAPELYGRAHSAVVRYDLADPSFVYVYETSGAFICRADEPPKVHPMARHLGTEADVKLLEEQITLKKRQEKEASVVCRALLTAEVLPAHRAQMEQLGFDGSAPALPAPVKEKPLDEAAINAEVEALSAMQEGPEVHFWAGMEQKADPEKYEKILEAEGAGFLIPTRWQFFARYFETLPTYQEYKEYYEELRCKFACAYQVQACGATGL